ncbi:MAG: hypothetical protein H7Y27_00600 [Gemmatimonadaceae bacterium]|nr:hypothetical protein [Chitinophagaceae bacterium]
MKRISGIILGVATLVFFSSVFTNSGCTKETIREITHDTVIYRDTIIKEVSQDSLIIVKNLLVGFWNVQATHIETYSGPNLIDTKWDYLSGTTTYNDFKLNGSYSFMYRGAPAGTGTWEIISPNYFVQDKGVAGLERFFYIIALDKKVLWTRGPFKANGTFYSPNNIYDFYLSK